jgi:hypothetical protein
MLVSAHFATMKTKRLEALQSIFSKARRVIAMPLKNRLKRRFSSAYGYANAPMKPKRHFVGFGSICVDTLANRQPFRHFK